MKICSLFFLFMLCIGSGLPNPYYRSYHERPTVSVSPHLSSFMQRIGWGLKSLDKKICNAEANIEVNKIRLNNLEVGQAVQDNRLDNLETTQDELEDSVNALNLKVPPQQCFKHYSFTDVRRLTTSASGNNDKFCDTTDTNLFSGSTYRGSDIEWEGDGWYRFTGGAGFRMPEVTEVPEDLHCNTGYPGYMKDTHPINYFETKDVTYCFRWMDENCEASTTGKVTNCGSFYVYYLIDTDFNTVKECNLGYCATDEDLPSWE